MYGLRHRKKFDWQPLSIEQLSYDFVVNLGEDLINWISKPRNLWFQTYLSSRGVVDRNVIEICSEYPIMQDYINRAKSIQAQKLIEMSFFKEANVEMAKFVLTNAHEGWADKSEQTVSINNQFSSVLDTIANTQGRLPSISDSDLKAIDMHEARLEVLDD